MNNIAADAVMIAVKAIMIDGNSDTTGVNDGDAEGEPVGDAVGDGELEVDDAELGDGVGVGVGVVVCVGVAVGLGEGEGREEKFR